MPDTEAEIGYGIVLEMADQATPTVFVALGEVINVDPGDDEDEEVEATHYRSENRTREFIPGLTTPGELTAEGNYVPGSETDLALIGARGKKNVLRITLPNGRRATVKGVRKGYSQSLPIDDRMTFSATFKRSGAASWDAATAPVNGVLPSIAGIAQQGNLLTANPGIWAPFAEFTYQWKRDGANISGATGKTYTLVVGDVTKAITVTVTATNTGGSASATSAPTVAVAAP